MLYIVYTNENVMNFFFKIIFLLFFFINLIFNYEMYNTNNTDSNLIIITPTYTRITRIPDMLNIGTSIVESKIPILWIIIEDSENIDDEIIELLKDLNIKNFIYVSKKTNPKMKSYLRGITQRNYALQIIREKKIHGIIYFADDDNTYHPKLFQEIYQHKNVVYDNNKIFVFNVGLIAGKKLEGPIVSSSSTKTVVGWNTEYKKNRRFAIDMAGFAFSTNVLYRYHWLRFQENVPKGEQEDNFLRMFVYDWKYLYPLKTNKVLVWHRSKCFLNMIN